MELFMKLRKFYRTQPKLLRFVIYYCSLPIFWPIAVVFIVVSSVVWCMLYPILNFSKIWDDFQ